MTRMRATAKGGTVVVMTMMMEEEEEQGEEKEEEEGGGGGGGGKEGEGKGRMLKEGMGIRMCGGFRRSLL